MAKVKIEAYIEENEFKNDKGEDVKFLSLVIPVTDTAEKRIKAEQFVLQLAKDRAERSVNPFWIKKYAYLSHNHMA